MAIVVGLDLSLTSTGVSIDDETFVIASTNKGMQRLADIRSQLMDLISTDCLVCVEGYSFASRNSQSHAAGELGGVIRLELWERQIPYVDIPPTTRAKFATGRGNAGKDEVVSSISAKTGIVWGGKGANDRCDAWILQEMGLAHLGQPRYAWPAVNLSALDKIDWTPFHAN